MGVDLLRGGGGRSQFLVALLSLLSLFLLFNWWSISADNLDLLKQMEGLTEHLKATSNLLDQCRHDRTSLDSRNKRLEDESQNLVQKLEEEKQQLSQMENRVNEKNKEVSASGKKFDDVNSSWKMCVAELDSLKKVDISKDGVIASMRIANADLKKQLQELTEQLAEAKLQQSPQKKPGSSTASVPSKIENDGDNEVRNIPAPFHAEEKEAERKGDNIAEKDNTVDERELEMQDNGDEKKNQII